MSADGFVTSAAYQHELPGRRNLAAVARLHGAKILTKGEQVKTAWHYQPLGEALQLLPGGERQQIERFGTGGG